MKVKNMSRQGFVLHSLNFGLGKNEVKDLPKELEKNPAILDMLKSKVIVKVVSGKPEPEDSAKTAGSVASVPEGAGKEFESNATGAVTSQPPAPAAGEDGSKNESTTKTSSKSTSAKKKSSKKATKKATKKTT